MPPDATLGSNVNVDTRQIGISEIALKSNKPFKSVKIKILTTNGSVVRGEVKTHEPTQATFHVPSDTPLSSEHTLRIVYSQNSIFKKAINVAGADLLAEYKWGGAEKQVWKRSYEKVELVVELANRSRETQSGPQGASHNPLHPTTDAILESCPRFRILVMGKSGAGKSSLINKAFGVTDAQVSHALPGAADINREIPSNDNPRFLLHDSQGFDHGETDTLQVVKDFIENRSRMVGIKDKLHAIWICIEIPTAGGRVMETGVEEFLKLKAAEELGQVPIIVVFTKYDRLVSTERVAMTKAGMEPTIEEAEEKAEATLKMECIAPFEALVGKTIPYKTVSTRPHYSKTLADLIEITFEDVKKYIMEAGVVTGISQKVNAGVKIRTSIEVGKQKYWRGLASDGALPGITLQEFLGVIHTDIVKVWDLEDRHKFLHSSSFKKMMLDRVEPTDTRRPNRILVGGLPVLGALAGIISALSGPAAPIVIPIAAGILIAVWANEIYHKSRTNLRRIMTYILNLTLVMQNLFWIQNILATKPQRGGGGGGATERVTVPITRRLIKLAYQLYFTANDRDDLITQIDEYAKKVTFALPGGSDATVDKIIELINSSTISDEQAFRQHSRIKVLDGSWEHQEDEPWDIPQPSPS